QGEISLKAAGSFPGLLDNVRVSAGGRELFLEDFEEFPEGALDGQLPHNWKLKDGKAFVGQGMLNILGSAKMTRADQTWKNFRLEADQANTIAKGESIQIGGDTFSRFSFNLAAPTQQALLNWEFSPPGELGLEPQGDSLSLPILLMDCVFYRLSLEALDGVVNASVKDPVLWGDTSEGPVGYLWSSLALVGDLLAFTRGDQIYLLTQEGKLVSQSKFAAPVSEIRVWQNPKDGAPWVGVCVPDLDQILMARVPASNPSSWPRRVSPDLGFAIGPGLGSSTDFLYYPTSFAVGPDGRCYVLDAGNARVVVFDADRQALTQWGHKGSGEGEFDFGKRADHFAGSIAVDSEGYIYVLDVFNQRIQKFAP
ncbi:MAG: NHL repeat-containing protein, partial [Chloroflexi bacterium]|nr:NHL repeat-containing protein [Chloroflexota bacterium]